MAANDEEKQDSEAVEDVSIGVVMPDFSLTCLDGKEHKLSDFRGSKVLLCFYRMAYCVNCAYSVGKLMGRYKKLAWAAKLKVITVFQTNPEWLEKGLNNSNAPLARLLDDGCYPFLALADPEGKAASTFKVASASSMFIELGKYIVALPELSKMHGACIATSVFHGKDHFMELNNITQNPNLLPSEFLINEDGVLIDALRAKDFRDSMDVDRIAHFLLTGKKLSPEEH